MWTPLKTTVLNLMSTTTRLNSRRKPTVIGCFCCYGYCLKTCRCSSAAQRVREFLRVNSLNTLFSWYMLIDGHMGSVISSLFIQVTMKMSIYYCGSFFFGHHLSQSFLTYQYMCVCPGLSLNAATSGDVFDLRRVNQEVEPPSKLFFCFVLFSLLFF